jgi:20S proteasome alpha/beta subunit
MTINAFGGTLRLSSQAQQEVFVTVCIAAIHSDHTVLGISDRMVTAGDIQFEPPSPKIHRLTNSIALMKAGDTSLQTQLTQQVSPRIWKMIDTDREKWVPIEEVAKLYRDAYGDIRSERAEKRVLAPYGLDFGSFIAKQQEFTASFLNDLTSKLRTFEIEDAATIVTGVDDTGPHIYVVTNGHITCADKIGFAAVGIGANHALSHFMLSAHAPSTPETKALLTIHQAKKKAEVSPGVGEQTDLFAIGPKPGSYTQIDPVPGLDIVGTLDMFYNKYQKGIARLDTVAEARISSFLSQAVQAPPQTQEADPPLREMTATGTARVPKKPEAAKKVFRKKVPSKSTETPKQ